MVEIKIRSMDMEEVMDNGGIGSREVHISLKEKAYSLGLSESSIMSQIRQGFYGEEAQRLLMGR